MNDRNKAAVNEALERSRGNREEAAKRMGWPKEKLYKAIAEDPDLNAHWSEYRHPLPEPGPEENIIPETTAAPNGPGAEAQAKLDPETQPKAVVLSASDAALVRMARIENAAVRKGLEAMGLSVEEATEAVAIQAFQREFFQHSVELIGGGVTRSSIKLRTECTEIEKRLELVRSVIHGMGSTQDAGREKWVKEEEVLMRAHARSTSELTRIFDISMKGAYIMALIRTSKRTLKQAKPGFTVDA